MMRKTVTRPATLTSEPTAAAIGRVRRALESVGCRYTRQRGAVYACLSRATDHPTTEEIFQQVRRRMPRISLATVYNSLEALVRAQVATRLAGGNGSTRYDCRAEDHYHLRDTSTGEIRDLATAFDADLLAKLDPRLPEELAKEGFQVTGYRLEVLGRFA